MALRYQFLCLQESELLVVMKVNPDGTITCLKAHLVAKCYAQTYRVDCSDTFSLVAKLTSI